MAPLAPITRKPSLTGFVLPLTAVAGALLGYLVGNAKGNAILGVLIGALFAAVLALVLVQVIKTRFTGRIVASIATGVVGALVAGVAGFVFGALAGLVLGWIVYWLASGDYRAAVPIYATSGEVLWNNTFRFVCGVIFFFLIAPVLVVIPLSFNAENFFTFTPKMLALDPDGYSLKHYRDFFTNTDWTGAFYNSLRIAPAATILSAVSSSRPPRCRCSRCRSRRCRRHHPACPSAPPRPFLPSPCTISWPRHPITLPQLPPPRPAAAGGGGVFVARADTSPPGRDPTSIFHHPRRHAPDSPTSAMRVLRDGSGSHEPPDWRHGGWVLHSGRAVMPRPQ